MNGNLLRSRWQRLPEAVVRRLQAEQLRHYLRTVVLPFSPHYSKLFRERGLTADSIHTLADLEKVNELGRGKIDLTIGSALDIFGGTAIRYADAVAHNKLAGRI